MSKIIESNTAYVGEPARIYYHREKPRLADDEICSYISIPMVCLLFYIVKVIGDTYLNIDYVYENGFVKENVSIAFSKVSDFTVQAFIMNLKIGAMSGQQMNLSLIGGRSLHVRV